MPIEVCICAEGTLAREELAELADLGVASRGEQVLLDGTVADQAALLGALELLRRAGLRIRDVEAGSRDDADDRVVTLAVSGRAGSLLRAVLEDAVILEDEATTTATLRLGASDDLFDVLSRLGALGLDLRAVHVGRSADPPPGGGHPQERRSHLG